MSTKRKSRVRRANFRHECGECQRVIEKGEHYMRIDERDRAVLHKVCSGCWVDQGLSDHVSAGYKCTISYMHDHVEETVSEEV